MAENETKDCPYCAEPVRVQATICPHCRSTLTSPLSQDAHRGHPGRQLGGVCIGIAEAFGVSVTVVRLAFVVLTFVSFIGPPLYVVLWLLIPAEPGGQSPLGRVIDGESGEPSLFQRAVQATEEVLDRVAAWLRGPNPPPSPPDLPKAPSTTSGAAEDAS